MKELIRGGYKNVVYGNFGGLGDDLISSDDIDDRVLEKEDENRRIIMASEKLEQLGSQITRDKINTDFNQVRCDELYQSFKDENLGELAFKILRFPEENIKNRFSYFKALSKAFEDKLMKGL